MDMLKKTFNLGTITIGCGEKTILLPEIGTFFNQDINQAIHIVDKIADAGISIVKGEILHSAEICLKNDSGKEFFWGQDSKRIIEENYRALIERKIVSLHNYERIFLHCLKRKMQFVVSVYDFEGATFAYNLGAVGLKVASSNITHQPLIEFIAKLNIPMFIDTGHSTIEEIARAINWAQDAGADKIVVQHSPLAPPNPVEHHNLKFMNTLGMAFGVPYSLSDHHSSEEMLYAATALGASVVEKGVCGDNVGDEQDRGHALPISRLQEVNEKVNSIFMALGSGNRNLPRSRKKYNSRNGLIAKKKLVPGDVVDLTSVSFAFPAKGIPVENWEQVQGAKVTSEIKAGEIVKWNDICYDFT